MIENLSAAETWAGILAGLTVAYGVLRVLYPMLKRAAAAAEAYSEKTLDNGFDDRFSAWLGHFVALVGLALTLLEAIVAPVVPKSKR